MRRLNSMKDQLLRVICLATGSKVGMVDEILNRRVEDIEMSIRLGQSMDYISYRGGGYCYPLLTSIFFNQVECCRIMVIKGFADVNLKFSRLVDAFFDDPEAVFTNAKFPKEELKKININITPTTLSFILGRKECLDICLRNGGILSEGILGKPLMDFLLQDEGMIEVYKLLWDFGIVRLSSHTASRLKTLNYPSDKSIKKQFRRPIARKTTSYPNLLKIVQPVMSQKREFLPKSNSMRKDRLRTPTTEERRCSWGSGVITRVSKSRKFSLEWNDDVILRSIFRRILKEESDDLSKYEIYQ